MESGGEGDPDCSRGRDELISRRTGFCEWVGSWRSTWLGYLPRKDLEYSSGRKVGEAGPRGQHNLKGAGMPVRRGMLDKDG